MRSSTSGPHLRAAVLTALTVASATLAHTLGGGRTTGFVIALALVPAWVSVQLGLRASIDAPAGLCLAARRVGLALALMGGQLSQHAIFHLASIPGPLGAATVSQTHGGSHGHGDRVDLLASGAPASGVSQVLPHDLGLHDLGLSVPMVLAHLTASLVVALVVVRGGELGHLLAELFVPTASAPPLRIRDVDRVWALPVAVLVPSSWLGDLTRGRAPPAYS